jgi:lysozyme
MIIGCDISSWQDKPETPEKTDFAKMKSAGASFCFMRAFFGMVQDHDFSDYWKAAKGVIPRGAYMFPLASASIEIQTQRFIDLLKPDKGELPPVLDIEKFNGTVPNATAIKTAIKLIESQLGKKPIIYTGFYVWRDEVKGSNDPFFSGYDLWIATYAPKPMIPPPWTSYKFWQYTDKGDGLKFGVESLNVDMDSFNGDDSQFKAYAGSGPALPADITDADKLVKLWQAHPELH